MSKANPHVAHAAVMPRPCAPPAAPRTPGAKVHVATTTLLPYDSVRLSESHGVLDLEHIFRGIDVDALAAVEGCKHGRGRCALYMFSKHVAALPRDDILPIQVVQVSTSALQMPARCYVPILKQTLRAHILLNRVSCNALFTVTCYDVLFDICRR